MAEYSFPILEQPLSDQQWGQVTEGFGSGILARGSEPYGIPAGGIDNAANTVQLAGRSSITGDGRAVVSGFFHRFDANVTLTIPPVSATTTYHLGLTYDPTQHAATGGPVKLTVTTSVPSGGGKVYLPIYRITRRANELLANATIADQRAFIAPSITVKGATALPPADSVLTYTIATDFESGEQWQMTLGGSWRRALNSREVGPLSMAGWGYRGSWITLIRRPDGNQMASIEAELYRTGSTFTQGSEYVTHGVFLPPAARSARGLIYVPAMIGTAPGFVALNTTNGQLLARTASGTTTMQNGARISFQTQWVVS